jgi:enoyl-CoA hydratase/carnithine racemase
MNVHTTLEGGIALVRMDRPPANAMEPGFLEEIATTFEPSLPIHRRAPSS